MKNSKRVNISISRESYNRLCKLGRFGESFSELMNRILDEHEKIH